MVLPGSCLRYKAGWPSILTYQACFPLSSYAFALQYPVLTYVPLVPGLLRHAHALCAEAGTLRPCYAVSGTDIAHSAASSSSSTGSLLAPAWYQRNSMRPDTCAQLCEERARERKKQAEMRRLGLQIQVRCPICLRPYLPTDAVQTV
eukprot:1221163-Rhodomonas_salina.1